MQLTQYTLLDQFIDLRIECFAARVGEGVGDIFTQINRVSGGLTCVDVVGESDCFINPASHAAAKL
jgi:hypothetical protein